jgi:hypothetical protein
MKSLKKQSSNASAGDSSNHSNRQSIDEDSIGNRTVHHPTHQHHQQNHHNEAQPPRRDNSHEADEDDEPTEVSERIGESQELNNMNNDESSHYNDTMFGDENAGTSAPHDGNNGAGMSNIDGRTFSPNELDSLRHEYQNNMTKHDGDQVDEEENSAAVAGAEAKQGEGFKNYMATGMSVDSMMNRTAKSENDDVVVSTSIQNKDSWDPNDSSRYPPDGNQDNVIIEISNFSLNANSNALQRPDIQRLFVGMEFLNLDPLELESQTSMPKPRANQLVHFNFRKGELFIFQKFYEC